MVVVNFKHFHGAVAFGTKDRIITKGTENRKSPLVKGSKNSSFIRLNNSPQCFVNPLHGKGINTVITDHFEMLLWDMLDEAFHELKCRNGFDDEFLITVTVVVEGDMITVIGINSFGGDGRSAEISANIGRNLFHVTLVGFCIDVETILMEFIDESLIFFKRRTDFFLQKIEENSAERMPKESVVEVFKFSMGTINGDSGFGDDTVDMRIPLKRATKGMKNKDKAGSKAFGFVFLVKKSKKDSLNGREETVQERTVIEEKMTELLRNGKDAVTVSTVNKPERHSSGAVNGVHVATSRAKAGVTSERNKLKETAFAEIHGTTEGRITAVEHPVDVFNDGRSRMGDI